MELPRGMALLNENTIIETNPFGVPGQFSYGHVTLWSMSIADSKQISEHVPSKDILYLCPTTWEHSKNHPRIGWRKTWGPKIYEGQKPGFLWRSIEDDLWIHRKPSMEVQSLVSVRFLLPIHGVLHGRPVVQAWSFSTPQSAPNKIIHHWNEVVNFGYKWCNPLRNIVEIKKMLHKQWKTHLQMVDCRLHLGNLGNMFFLWINCW